MCVVVIVVLVYIKNLCFTDMTTSFCDKLNITLPTTTIATILDINDLIDIDESNNFALLIFIGGLIFYF